MVHNKLHMETQDQRMVIIISLYHQKMVLLLANEHVHIKRSTS